MQRYGVVQAVWIASVYVKAGACRTAAVVSKRHVTEQLSDEMLRQQANRLLYYSGSGHQRE